MSFTLELTGVSSSTPTGSLRLELASTTMPDIVNDHVFTTLIVSAGAYYPNLKVRNLDVDTLEFYQLGFDDFTPTAVSDANFSSTEIYITGTYITN